MCSVRATTSSLWLRSYALKADILLPSEMVSNLHCSGVRSTRFVRTETRNSAPHCYAPVRHALHNDHNRDNCALGSPTVDEDKSLCTEKFSRYGVQAKQLRPRLLLQHAMHASSIAAICTERQVRKWSAVGQRYGGLPFARHSPSPNGQSTFAGARPFQIAHSRRTRPCREKELRLIHPLQPLIIYLLDVVALHE